MADHNKPGLTDPYTQWPGLLKGRIDDALLLLEGVSATNLPTGAKRWNSAGYFERWNGSQWIRLVWENPVFGGRVLINGAAEDAISRLVIKSASNVPTEYAIRANNSAQNYAAGYGAYGLSNRLNALNLSVDYAFDIGRHINFKTADLQRMRLTSIGNLLLGATTDNGVDLLQSAGSVQSTTHFKVGSNQVVGARDTGWTPHSGTISANKGAWQADILPQAAAATPTKAEFDALVQALNGAMARIKALETMARTHGLIN